MGGGGKKFFDIIMLRARAVASLTVPGGQEFHFPHFPSNFDQFLFFFLKLYLFSSSHGPSGWASRPPGKALATPLLRGVQKVLQLAKGGSKKFDAENFQLPSPRHQSISEHSLILKL